MPYRARRRYRGKKRRRGRRRGRKGNFAKAVRRAVYSTISRPRKWINETKYTLNIDDGYKYFLMPSCMLDRSDLVTSWNDTGDGGNILGGTTANNARCTLKLATMRCEMVNLNVHPMYVRVYWLTAKQDIFDATSCRKAVVDALGNGWKDKMLDADETTAGINVSATHVATSSQMLSVYQSEQLMNNWRIKKGAGGWLQPGRTHMFTYKRKLFRNFLYEDIQEKGGATDGKLRTKAGLTVIPLFVIQMNKGKQTDDQSVFTSMNGYVNVNIYKTIIWTKVQGLRSLIAYSSTKDENFGVNNAEAPTDQDMKEDDL